MAYQNENLSSLPITLETHFEVLARQSSRIERLHSLWVLFRNDLENALPHSGNLYVHYSLHDTTHSKSVIQAIERFLGEERIEKLSATDTFMLLVCAYAHDYGMAMTFNLVYETLGTDELLDFLRNQKEKGHALPEDELHAVENLLSYIDEARVTANIQELYFSIMVILQSYLRPSHWRGIEQIWSDFSGLLEGRLNGRFIRGQEGIIEICESHGKSFSEIMKMGIRSDGIVGDDFHPRFIASMLRLGDLLDLDNGRFPRWFVSEIGRNRGLIPKLSILHYKKHEAITHLLITPKRIEVCASCTAADDGYEVASLIREWLEWLEMECREQTLHWSEIAQPDFGRPPCLTKSEILVDGKKYASENYKLQMHMSQDRVMKLLEGTSIYKDKYVGIRELVQNAVDASLLQLWHDVTQNRYINLNISKHGHELKESYEKSVESENNSEENKSEVSLLEWRPEELSGIFKNYNITVELIHDKKENAVQIVVKDKGTGITPSDVQYMADIGTSKEKNRNVAKIMKNMPRWLKPAGVFGIGLQSAFQITDEISFYTRRPNEPERLIVFHSYGRNQGKIEIREMSPDAEGIFYNNSVPGTNVKITINPEKILRPVGNHREKAASDSFSFYDTEFDSQDTLHGIFVELSRVISRCLHETPSDYFDIYFRTIEKLEDGTIIKNYRTRYRYSYFSPHKTGEGTYDDLQTKIGENSILSFFPKKGKPANSFTFSRRTAAYADEKACWIHHLTLRKGEIKNEKGEKYFQLPEPIPNLYSVKYKFHSISDVQFIYPPSVRKIRGLHADFLNWTINVMDDEPTKYLNIDRDRLREGAIYEEELEETRSLILEKWCEHLIKEHKGRVHSHEQTNRKARANYVHKNREQDFVRREPKGIFDDDPCALVSLALLFYGVVPESLFREFMEPYNGFITQQNLKLMDDGFAVKDLWAENTVFKCEMMTSSKCTENPNCQNEDTSQESVPARLIKASTLSKLPHRLIHIDKVLGEAEGKVTYYLRLGCSDNKTEQPNMIEMNKRAQTYDYCGAIESETGGHKFKTNVDSLVRKLFKPNKEYPYLVVPKYPNTFKRGNNFSLPLDHCIRWYILSPFDRDLTKWLKETISDRTADFKDSYTDAEYKELQRIVLMKVEKHMEESLHAQKCIEYVFKQKVDDDSSRFRETKDSLKNQIKQQYIDFLKECCMTLITHDLHKDKNRNQEQ